MTERKYKYFVANVIVAFDLGRKVDTIALYQKWAYEGKLQDFKVFIYDDERSSGWLDVQPRNAERNIKIRLYMSGKGMVVGARTEEEALQHLDAFADALDDLF